MSRHPLRKMFNRLWRARMNCCCECKQRVWPWQQSTLTFDPIHQKCHDLLIFRQTEAYHTFLTETGRLKLERTLGTISDSDFRDKHAVAFDRYMT